MAQPKSQSSAPGVRPNDPDEFRPRDEGRSARRAGDLEADARDKFEHASRDARQAAEKVGRRARDQASRAGETVKHQVADQIRAFGSMAHAAADRGEDEDASPAPKYAHDLAESMDDAANYFENASLSEIADDARRFGRRHPALLIGGLALLGFAAGRVLTARPESEAADDRFDQDRRTLPSPTRASVASPGAGSTPRDAGRPTATPTATTSRAINPAARPAVGSRPGATTQPSDSSEQKSRQASEQRSERSSP